VLIGKAEALAEHPEDPLLLFSVLYGLWVAKYVAFDGDVLRQLAADFLDLAEKEGATVPLMIGHRLMGMSLLHTGDISQGRAHYDRGVALYSQTEHRLLASRFGQDIRVAILSYRSWTQWILGYPDLGLIDADRALKDAREIGQAATLMYALNVTSLFHMICRNFESTCAEADELVLLADGKGAKLWKALGVLNQGCVLALTGEASDAVAKLTSGISAFRATGSSIWMPWYQSHLARAYAEIGQFGDAWHQIDEAMSGMGKTKEKWCEAELNRVAGEIALMSPERDAARAEAYFDHALTVARQQQAKSWELRAAMSLARLRRDQEKVQQARDLLAPVYRWFTEGFDTRDLKDAKALLDALG
jgi:predicted ATPase